MTVEVKLFTELSMAVYMVMLLPRRLGREDHGYVKRPLSTKKGDERGLENNYTLLIPGKTFVFWRIL